MTTHARTTDDVTSHEAAARLVASGAMGTQCALVLVKLRLYPGSTSAELADLDEGDDALDRHLVARRLPNLRDQGLVRKGAPRKCQVGYGRAMTWWPIYQSKQGQLF